MGSVFTILEFLQVVMAAYRFLDNQITAAQFNASVSARKDAREKYAKETEIKIRAKYLKEFQDEFNKR